MFFVAVLEGKDLQSVGVAASGMAVAFGLNSSMMYCGVPLGGALGCTGQHGGLQWWLESGFLCGRGALLLVPILWLFLAESAAFRTQQGRLAASPAARASLWDSLFTNGAVMPTLRLLISYFFTLMAVYMLLNWLPSLLVGQGFSGQQAGIVQILFSIGGGGSLLLGLLLVGSWCSMRWRRCSTQPRCAPPASALRWRSAAWGR